MKVWPAYYELIAAGALQQVRQESRMQLGMIGLGRMGASMVRRLASAAYPP